MKRGLVIEGGGAKGAYAFGAILALHDQRVKFDCVAGTSVGGLNAALMACGKLKEGKFLWENLSHQRVYPLLRPYFLSLPLMLFHFICRKYSDRMLSTEASAYRAHHNILIGWCFVILFGLGVFFSPQHFTLFDVDYLFSTIVALMFIVTALAYVTPRVLDRLSVSAFSSKPLRSEIIAVLQGAQFNMPTYITIARYRDVYDPDNLNWDDFGEGYPEHFPVGPQLPNPRFEYVPLYVDLSNLKFDDMVETLMATAALPYGIVRSVKGQVDGGLADNCPVYPLVKWEECDEIVVLNMTPVKSKNGSSVDYKKVWRNIDRLLRISRYQQEDAARIASLHSELGRFRDTEPELDPNRWPHRVLNLYPKENLGGLLRGTMNFKSNYTRRLLKMGYEDGTKFITREQLSAVGSS